MAIDFAALEKSLTERFGADLLGFSHFRNQFTLRIKASANLAVLRFLRDDPTTSFEFLTDVTCVDGSKLPDDMLQQFPERFAVVYQLTSMKNSDRMRVKAFVPEEPAEIDSASSLWAAAVWGEREAYDMFGVTFRGHPDLRRILMPDNYEGHPLRKDYPLKGRGERDNFPKYTEIPVDQS
jgi:NADH-quinone oxidoreductase subunit C